MTDKTLVDKVTTLNPGDEIRATCVYAGHTATRAFANTVAAIRARVEK